MVFGQEHGHLQALVFARVKCCAQDDLRAQIQEVGQDSWRRAARQVLPTNAPRPHPTGVVSYLLAAMTGAARALVLRSLHRGQGQQVG